MKPKLPVVLLLLLALALARATVTRAVSPPAVLIRALYYDPFVAGEAAEAIELQNMSANMVSLAGWHLSDGEGTVTFPADTVLNSHAKIWLARSAQAFENEFGFLPAYEYGSDTDANVPNLSGSAPSLNNAGDEVMLRDDEEGSVDALAYGTGVVSEPDWYGVAVTPYTFGSASAEGQILFRKRDEASGLPLPDTNTRADWVQDPLDDLYGKKGLYPGWDEDEFFQTTRTTETSNIRFCVAPDHLYTCVRDELLAATESIAIEIYSLAQAQLLEILIAKLDAGVSVKALLDGGGMDAQGKWACQQLEAHGGECWIMASKPQANIPKRYDNVHAKWLVLDHARVLLGSENIGADAMPADDKKDGTEGSRGGMFITDNPTIVATAEALLNRDGDPAKNSSVRRWGTNTDDFPPLDFVPSYDDGGKKYPLRFPTPFAQSGAIPLELIQCPENCLRVSDAYLGMLAKAGAGDTLRIEQLYEYLYWGKGASHPDSDPNVRLEAYLAAARRGARVRILLDRFFDAFDDPRSNYATCTYVNSFRPRLDIECRLGNPTGRGIHNKMALLARGATGWVHLGSINGSETSNKLNRELAIQVESRAAHDYWARVFDADWDSTTFAPQRVFLPMLFRR